jgi:nucleotide-binding universal stress UspA family protein
MAALLATAPHAETYVVGFDESLPARVALRFAERLAERTGATLLATTDGDASSDGLRALAANEGASLLVVGATHGRPGGEVALGAVARELVDDPPCAIVVVPDPYEDAPTRAVLLAHDGAMTEPDVLSAARDLAMGLRATLVTRRARRRGYAGPGSTRPLSSA